MTDKPNLPGYGPIGGVHTGDMDKVTPNSLAYRMIEIEKHFHGVQQSFGGNAATGSSTNLQAQSVDALRVTGGADAFGTETQISVALRGVLKTN